MRCSRMNLGTRAHGLTQHPDEHRPERPVSSQSIGTRDLPVDSGQEISVRNRRCDLHGWRAALNPLQRSESQGSSLRMLVGRVGT
jgi:hypothetical protein